MTPWIEIDIIRHELTLEQRSALQPVLEDVLFEYMARQGADGDLELSQPMSLPLSKAAEILAAHQPRWHHMLKPHFESQPFVDCPLPKTTNSLLQSLLSEALSFFRQEGGESWSVAMRSSDPEHRFLLLWSDFFNARLLDWLQRQELTTNNEQLELADTLVECAKLWLREVATGIGEQTQPSVLLPSLTEEQSLTLRRGPLQLKLRGCPPVLVKQQTTQDSWLNYCICDDDAVYLQLAYLALTLGFMTANPGATATQVFLVPKINQKLAQFPLNVSAAFAGFVGNAALLRRMQAKVTLGLTRPVPRLSKGLLLVGGTGCGKSDLVQRMATAMNFPLVEVSAAFTRSAGDLIQAIRKSLERQGLAGTPDKPVLLALDHPQHWQRNAQEFEPMFDESTSSLISADDTLDLRAYSVVVMTPSLSQVPEYLMPYLQSLVLQSYRPAEIAQLISESLHKQGLALPEDALLLLARVSRCLPSRALDYTRDLLEHHRAEPTNMPLSSQSIRHLAANLWRVDELGLADLDYLYLQALESGPRGLPALQQLLPISAEEMALDVEPYLIDIAAVQRSPRGRALTAYGENLIHRRRSEQREHRLENEQV